MRAPFDQTDVERARENIAQGAALSPFDGPMKTSAWDSQEISERSQMIHDLFGEDLALLAAAGDMGSLRLFFNAPWMDAAQRHRDRGQWAQELFEAADPALLPSLIREFATPNAVNDDYKPGHPTHSPVWRDCVAIALARAQGDPLTLAAVEGHLSAIAQSPSDIAKHLPEMIHLALPRMAPQDLAFALKLGSDSLDREPGEPRVSPASFCSGVQAAFVPRFPPRPQGLAPEAPFEPEDIERARIFLDWAREADFNHETSMLSTRLLSLSGSFCRIPELAPSLARVFERHDAMQGCSVSSMLRSGMPLAALPGDGPAPPGSANPALLLCGPISPIDQALSWGAEEAALALSQAGFAWDSQAFIDACKTAMTSSQATHPLAHCVAKAMVRAERLALRLAASPAIATGPGTVRL